MGHRTFTIIVCMMLSASSALAAGPLPPGKPAGVRRAQNENFYGAIAVGALAVIAIGGYAISARPYRIPGTAAASATSTQP